MTIRKILMENTNDWCDVDLYTVERAIKEYAEFYAQKVLEKAADEVVVDFYIPDDASIPDYVKDEIEVYALKHSITDIELPKHE